MEEISCDVKIEEVFYDVPTYTLLKQFGFNTIRDILEVDSIYSQVPLRLDQLETVFYKLIDLGFVFLKIKNPYEIKSLFERKEKCRNCGQFCIGVNNTGFCYRCDSLNKLSVVNDKCYWYYSKEKDAVVVRNASSKVFNFDLDVEDAYLVINNREFNLIDDERIFEFQSGIMPNSERVLIDLSGFESYDIQSLVLVVKGVYYEFTTNLENLVLRRVVGSTNSTEISYYDNQSDTSPKGVYCRTKVDLYPLIEKNYCLVQKKFELKENQEFLNGLKKAVLGCTLVQLGVNKIPSNTKIDYEKITLEEILSYSYEDLNSVLSHIELEELILNTLNGFWTNITNVEKIFDEQTKKHLILKNKLAVLGYDFENILSEEILDISNVTIEAIKLSERAYRPLKRAGINEIQQIVSMTEEDYMKVRGLGRLAMLEISSKLTSLGYSI